MKHLIVIVLVIIFGQAQAQVTLKLVEINQCRNTQKIDSDYSVIDEQNNFYMDSLVHGIIILPHSGKYNVSFPSKSGFALTVNVTKDTGEFIYSYVLPKIYSYQNSMDGPFVFRDCDGLLNGYHEDFYPNGNVRLKGNFDKGKPQDSLMTFYKNGNVKTTIFYLPKYLIIWEYDSSSNMIKISHNKRTFFLTDYKTTEYFSNGKVKRKETYLRMPRIRKVREYYPDGHLKAIQTKRHRLEYFENGNKQVVCTWTRKKEEFWSRREPNHDFTITSLTFDENGQLVKKAIYDEPDRFGYDVQFDIHKSFWIISMVQYQNGKEVSRVEDIDTKKYFEVK